MKKRSEYVPLELSGEELETFVDKLGDRLYSEFWTSEDDSRRQEIINRIKKNIYSVLETSTS
jgi:hypothetical protein